MATIKTTGSGSALRVITKTVDGQVRVSCGCCDPCGSLPETLTVVFSGIQKCPDSILDVTNGLYEVVRSGGEWIYDDSTYYVSVECLTAVQWMAGSLPNAADYLPNGIAIDDSTTPIFGIIYGKYYTEDGDLFLYAFYRPSDFGYKLASEMSAGNNSTNCIGFPSGFDGTIGFGGTATISWE